ncbi:MAG: anhydro-N-acetylmuramic acid kinase [Woeseiaceae bacterium]|nr:anhydro-N-acetylmuramic acid kinase [Woeseiaceae bacterium]
MPDYYVGLMSGTSMDGIDAVVVEFGDSSARIHSALSQPYPNNLRELLIAAIRKPLNVKLDRSGKLDYWVGECFRDAAIAVIDKSNFKYKDIIAIGSHGQTLRHQPNATNPFSLQIGNASIIANGTGITTISNFRKADITAGGQGAPLVPPFHRWLFTQEGKARVIVNIGGITNITILNTHSTDILGFDIGPGNVLMDAWTRLQLGQTFDESGKWASQGSVIPELLNEFLADPYFSAAPPKSTGFEYFNLTWLQKFDIRKYDAVDVQSTLCELSSVSISRSIKEFAPNTQEVFICGGGVHNLELMHRLSSCSFKTASTASIGVNPDWIEASAFAWLAMRTIKGQPGNLPSVTGAAESVVLGDINTP